MFSVITAIAHSTRANKVVVEFNQPALQVDPAGTYDALDPSHYTITGSDGSAPVVSSVTTINPYVVMLNLSGLQSTLVTYVLNAISIKSVDGELISGTPLAITGIGMASQFATGVGQLNMNIVGVGMSSYFAAGVGTIANAALNYPNTILADTPLHYWRLNELLGSTFADIGSNPQAGTKVGTVSTGTGDTPLYSAPSTKSPDFFRSGYIDIGSLDGGGWIPLGTVEFWIKPAGWGQYPNPIATKPNGGFTGDHMRFEQNLSNLSVGIGNTETYHSFGTIVPSTWHHIVLTWDSIGGTVKGFVDGVVVFNEAHGGSWPSTIPDFVIGVGYNTDSSREWIGGIAEVAWYNYRLSDARVSAHYAAAGTAPTLAIPSEALYSWYEADYGVFNTIGNPATNGESVGRWADRSGNGRDILQASAPNAPTYVTNSMNSLPSLAFTSPQFLEKAAGITLIEPFEVFCVWRITSDPINFAGQIPWYVDDLGGHYAFIYWDSFADAGHLHDMLFSVGGPLTSTNAYPVSSLYRLTNGVFDDASTSKINTNGSADGSGAAGSGPGAINGRFRVGNYDVSGPNPDQVRGNIVGLITYAKRLTPAERQAVVDYLTTKYQPSTMPLNLVPWLPMQAYYSADSGLWQDTAGTVPANVDGDPVARWDDLSGYGRHLLQSNAGKQPVLKLNIANGGTMPVVRFDGVDDYMNVAFGGYVGSAFLVASNAASPFGGYQGAFSAGPGVGDGELMFVGNNGTTSFYTAAGRFGGASGHMFIDGTAGSNLSPMTGFHTTIGVSDSTPPFNLAELRVGLDRGDPNGNGYWSGDIASTGVFPTTISDLKRGDLQTFLKGKWGTGPIGTTDYINDQFNRGDESTITGPPVGGAYSSLCDPSQWGVVGQKLYKTGTAVDTFLVSNAGKSDAIYKLTIDTISGSQDWGLIFRYQDATHFWIFYADSTSIHFVNKNGGYADVVQVAYVTQPGDEFMVKATGQTMIGYINGVQKLQLTGQSLFQTATGYGVYTGGGQNNHRWDNLRAYGPP